MSDTPLLLNAVELTTICVLTTSWEREGNKAGKSENNTVESKLLKNSAQHVFTVGGELYVVLPLGKIFLLCPHDVCIANNGICESTDLIKLIFEASDDVLLCDSRIYSS